MPTPDAPTPEPSLLERLDEIAEVHRMDCWDMHGSDLDVRTYTPVSSCCANAQTYCDLRAATARIRELETATNIEWTCTGCDFTWPTDELEQAMPDGRYVCPICPEATRLIAVPRGHINALRQAMIDGLGASDA